jgi:hypothetical protein
MASPQAVGRGDGLQMRVNRLHKQPRVSDKWWFSNPKVKGRLKSRRLKSYLLLKADSHIACRAHAVSLPCRAAEGL